MTKQKWQQEEGQLKSIKYINNTEEVKLNWVNVLFSDGKVDGNNNNLSHETYIIGVYMLLTKCAQLLSAQWDYPYACF